MRGAARIPVLGAALAAAGCALPYEDKTACRDSSDCLSGYTCAVETCILESLSAVDAAPDAAPPRGCPERTARPGDPQSPVPAEAVRLGSVSIFSPLDLAALDGIRVVTGDLEVIAPVLESLELPDLEVIGRNFSVGADSAALTHASFGRLETVGGSLSLTAPGLARVELPRLASVGGESRLENLAVDRVDLPCLASVEGRFVVESSVALSVSAPRLASAGGVGIVRGRELLDLDLSALARVNGDLALEDLPELRAAELPSLERIERTLTIIDDVSLRLIAFPRLVAVGPGPHVVTRNYQLPTCLVTSLRARVAITSDPAVWNIRDNGSGTDGC